LSGKSSRSLGTGETTGASVMYVVEIDVRLIVSVESTVVVAAAVSIKVVENKLTLVNVTAASVSVTEAVTVLVLN